jgi:hypothetical protein
MTKEEYIRAKILEVLKAISERFPELRLCQILGNCYPRREPGYPRGDMYYVEDEDLLNKLIEYYNMDGGIYASKFEELS